jgi:Lrp/AsnC family transcriptional regulator for asnA, asnC and gidA
MAKEGELVASPNIDDIDREIIRLLQIDGRTSYSQLGRTVGLSDAAARQRVNRLTAEGYIDIVAVTDPVKMGLESQALLGIRVSDDARKVAVELGALDNTVYVVMTAGRFDVIAEIVTRNREEFIEVSNAVRLLPGVDSVEVLPYLGITKETYDWGVL